jgi:molybdate/tungstate transport system substrate-binding protein
MAFESENPDVDVQVEAHGSVQAIRHVTEIHDLVDVVVPADYALIPLLMYDNPIPNIEDPYADWYVEFASNRLVLAYTDDSYGREQITAENWYEILASGDVKFGLSDPRFDAAGYRTLMIIQLAEDFYENPTLFEKVFLGQFKTPFNVEKSGDTFIVHVPEILEPSENSKLIMRGSSVALIGLLESGDIDYAFEYESVSKQHGFKYLSLPDQLNMGNNVMNPHYTKAEVQLDFHRFSSVQPHFVGTSIGYGVTIPNNAPNPALAERFVAFLIGPEGQQILRSNAHPVLAVPLADGIERMPESLRNLTAPRP